MGQLFSDCAFFKKKKKKKEEESSGVGEESEDVDEPRLVTSPELPKLGW